jgi:hypothetical protein
MQLQAKCDSCLQHIESTQVSPGVWKDAILYDYRFTLSANGQATGNLTIHQPTAGMYTVGNTYPLTV